MIKPLSTVFIVDDDSSVRKALRRLVQSAGYDVVTFDGAAAYLQHGAPSLPACLVVDIRMPGVSGLDLRRAIEGTDHALPIIFITGHADEDDRKQALTSGVVDVLLKPLDGDVLLQAIGKAIDRSQDRL